MERAGRSLGNLKLSGKLSTTDLARTAWPTAVGKRIAAHAVAVNLVRDKLVVEVEDAVWQKQLFHLRFQILGRLREVIGDELIRELEFRIAVMRRPPQPALQLTESRDEADRIEDPILRRLYRQARDKATA